MFNSIIDIKVLIRHAEMLKKKKIKPGFDGMSIDGAYSWLHINGERLYRELYDDAYRPMPAVGFTVAKRTGSYRRLAKFTAIDTIVQNSVIESLGRKCEEIFSDSSFAYRPSRGITMALQRYVSLAGKHKFASKLDFTACFDNIDHSVLAGALDSVVDEAKLKTLIMRFVETPLSIDDEIIRLDKGLIQGMPLAPLLCNVYFHSFDMFMEKHDIDFIRYADDIVIFGESLQQINEYNELVTNYCENELKLTCNRNKCKTDSPVKLKYLGHKFECDRRGIITLDVNSDTRSVYFNWHESRINNNHRRVDILSDGILRQRDFSIMFDSDDQETSIPVLSTEMLNIHSNVIFDSGFLKTALKHGVIINIFDDKGKAAGSFYPSKGLSSPAVIHRQLLDYYDEEKRLSLAKEFVIASIHNSLLNIRYHNKYNESDVYKDAISDLSDLKKA